MKDRNILFVLLLTILIVFTAGCTSYLRDSSYTMRFFVNETGEILDGKVLNNDNLLGYTENGSLNTNLERLRPGLIALNGTYQGQPFEFYFEFASGNLNYSGINFSVRTSDIKKVLFNTSVLDIPKLEGMIFDLVNNERRKSGIKVLNWNDRIAVIAREYSKTLSVEGFHHKDTEGRDVGDRLKIYKIFYTVASENLYMLDGINESVNISENVFHGRNPA